jgi:hypothetical protein
VLKELAILDFRPLPCTDLNTWKYGEWTDIPQLKTRNDYYNWIDPIRVKLLQNIVKDSSFKVVLLFGKSLEKQWGNVIGGDFKKAQTLKHDKSSIKILTLNGVAYFLIPQSSRVTNNGFYDWVGSVIKEHLKQH